MTPKQLELRKKRMEERMQSEEYRQTSYDVARRRRQANNIDEDFERI